MWAKLTATLLALTATAPSTPPEQFKKTFAGKIGEYPVAMSLERNGDHLSGSYRYTNHDVLLQLKGAPEKDGSFTLVEQSKGKKTGSLSIEWKDAVSVVGTWKNAKGEGPLPIEMYEYSLSPSPPLPATPPSDGSVTVIERSAQLNSHNGAATVVFLEVSGLADAKVLARIQDALKLENVLGPPLCGSPDPCAWEDKPYKRDLVKLAAEYAAGDISDYEVGFDVHYNQNWVLSVEVTESGFPADAKFSAPYVAFVNLDLRTGKKLQLTDILTTQGLKVATKSLNRQLAVAAKRQLKAFEAKEAADEDAESIRESLKGLRFDPLRKQSVFWVTEEGIGSRLDHPHLANAMVDMYKDQYLPPVSYVVPWSDLHDCLKPEFASLGK
jgi:hypothetical protein